MSPWSRTSRFIMMVITSLFSPHGLSAAEPLALPKLKHTFIVISHRADHVRAPENTLEAIEDAVAAGADFVEIDVRTSQDGHLVIMHDSTVDRMTDGKGKISQMSFAEIRRLKVYNHSRPNGLVSQIPTLEEVFAKTKNRIHIYLDFKQADRSVVANLIRKSGLLGQVIVYDGLDAIPKWRAVEAEIPLIVTPPRNANSPDALVAFVKSSGADILDGNWDFYSPEMCEAAKRAGALVWPDIQGAGESPARWEDGVKRGFKGLQTDDPERLIGWLQEHHLR